MENDVLYNRIINVVHKEYGEGNTAVANPEGEPTDDLTSIQIGDDIYSISGGGGGSMLITMSEVEGDFVLDKTYGEIKTAIESGIFPYLLMPLNPDNERYVALVISYGYDEVYAVEFSPIGENSVLFVAETEDGVLTLTQGD